MRDFLLLLALFTAFFCCGRFLCEYNFMCWEIYIATSEWKGASDSREGIYIYCASFCSRKSSGAPKKAFFFRVSLPFRASRLKSHFRFVVSTLRYIVTAASDIYFCKHSHNVVVCSFVNLCARCIFVDLQPEEMWQQKEQNSRRFINYRNDHTMTAAFCAIERKFLFPFLHPSQHKSTNFDVTFHSWLFKFYINLDK